MRDSNMRKIFTKMYILVRDGKYISYEDKTVSWVDTVEDAYMFQDTKAVERFQSKLYAPENQNSNIQFVYISTETSKIYERVMVTRKQSVNPFDEMGRINYEKHRPLKSVIYALQESIANVEKRYKHYSNVLCNLVENYDDELVSLDIMYDEYENEAEFHSRVSGLEITYHKEKNKEKVAANSLRNKIKLLEDELATLNLELKSKG